MEHFIYQGLLIFIGMLFSIPMIRKPLSEDDGNWHYLSIFWKNGVRIYKDLFLIYGYFSIPWIAAKIYNSMGFRKPVFFHYFKAVWYIFNSLSIYWLTFVFWNDHALAFIAS
ncbi:MAG: hypothetical protein SV375_23040, partial [Thermodesulfobacteriota bacterium]|nr:hypothetical protein [Thermodesulfobacteriota bacterium]